MTGKLFNSSNQTEETPQNRTITDILALPPNQRKIVNYIRRNKQCTLEDLLQTIEENPDTIESDLQLLIQEGFLNIEVINGTIYYSFEFGQKKGIETDLDQKDDKQKIVVPNKPIGLIINPSSNYVITAGEEFILRVSVINQGGQSALIYLRLDHSCELVQQVCGYIEGQTVALNSGQSHEIVFKIPIPRETLVGNYKYRLEIDAPNHYPENTPIFHQAQLQVRPYIAQLEKESDPFFLVSPQTTSTNPFVTEVTQPISVTIQVYNRSDQVDRFRLTCTDLPPEWYKITYPEGTPLPGLVINTDGLELNPGEANTIVLTITPPQDAIAKIYAPTLRVYSENLLPKTEAEAQQQSSELVMLDLFYFQVQAYYQLNLEMNTRRGTIKEENDRGEYEIKLANKGNTARQLKLVVDPQNSEKYCIHQLTLDELILNPGESTKIRLDVSPQGSWKRQFYPNVLNFNVTIIDQEEIEIPNDQFDGILVIEGRPWWQFFFLILGILGTIGAFIFLIWYIFFRAKPAPQITSFNSQSVIYREVNNDVIRLNWEITQAKRIKTITVNGYYKDASPIAKPMIFDFSKGLPPELKDKCTLKQILICNGIVTNARKSEEYTFELTLVTTDKRAQIITSKTNPIKIEAIPIPEISEFIPTQPQYNESKLAKNPPKNQLLEGQILLNWTVKFVDQLQELTLVGKDKEGVVVYPAQSIFVVKVNDPKKVAQQLQLLPIKNNSILILQLINPETNQEEINTCLVKDGKQRSCIPIPNFCQIKTEFQAENLICRGFPTDIRKPGEYTFELTPIPTKPLEEPLPPKISDVIKILPIPLNILSFQVKVLQNGELIGLKNGQVLPQLAKYPIPVVNPNKPLVLEISWIVDGGSGLSVQLTPSPGNVKSEGKINYFVSTNAGSETITLTASDLSGNVVSRSFVIETVLPPEKPQGEGKNGQENGQKTPPPPSGTNQPLTPPPDRVPTLGEPPAVTPPQTPANGNNNQPSATPAPTPSTPPRPPEAPGSSPPNPPGRNAPPPAELPPKIQ